MKVTLIRYTPAPQELVALAGKLCYSPSTLDELAEGIAEHDQTKYLNKLTDMGHLSPVEHVSFTFGIEGVSRALLAQITRHRIASFSVQSQRYVGMGEMPCVTPPTFENDPDVLEEYEKVLEHIRWFYEYAVDRGIPKEDARYATPQAAQTRIVVTMNARELMHFIALRACSRAQWEIREVAKEMLKLCREVAPELFSNAGAACVRGVCPEGKLSCGHPWKGGERK